MVKTQLFWKVEVGCVQQAAKEEPENHCPMLRMCVKRRLRSHWPLLRAAPQCLQAVGILWASRTISVCLVELLTVLGGLYPKSEHHIQA